MVATRGAGIVVSRRRAGASRQKQKLTRTRAECLPSQRDLPDALQSLAGGGAGTARAALYRYAHMYIPTYLVI